MVSSRVSIVGHRGQWVIPQPLRNLYGIADGTLLIAEPVAEGILIRPAHATPAKKHTPEQVAAFILNSAVDAEDYARAKKTVRDMGLNPDKIPHDRPE